MQAVLKLGSSCVLAAALLGVAESAPATGPPDDARALKERLNQLEEAGKLREALPIAEKSLALAEQTAGAQSTNAAACLNDLASVHQGLGAYAKAEDCYRRALAILENTQPPSPLQTAGVLAGWGALCIEAGQFDEAEPMLGRALRIRLRELPRDHEDIGTSYSYLGWLFTKRGDYARAEQNYQRALDIRKKTLGLKNADTAGSFDDLALLYQEMGDFARAEPLYLQALKIREEVLPPTHPDLARSYNDLARFHYRLGEYSKAEDFYRRALEIRERALDAADPLLAVSLNNSGLFYMQIGDYSSAEPLLLRALEIKQKALKPEHPSLATALHNLGVLYGHWGNLELAESYFQRDIEISEKALGTNHAETAVSLHSLGAIYHEKRDYSRAQPAYLRALAIQERVLAPDHPSTANSLNDLGRLYAETGDLLRAEPLLARALRIREQVFGPHHPETARTLEDLARLEIDRGNRAEALRLAQRALEANEATLADVLSFTSEEQRLGYQRGAPPYSLLATLGSARPLATAVLHNKGIVLDSLLEDSLLVSPAADPQARELGAQLRSARLGLSQLLQTAPKDTAPQALQQRTAQKGKLAAQVGQIEAELARRFAGRGQSRRALSSTLEQVQHAVPEQTVLVEFIRYGHFLGRDQSEQRYGAVVIAKSGDPGWASLGPAGAIEKNIRLFQALMRGNSDEAALTAVLRSLYQQTWSRVEQLLPKGTRNIIISADAELTFLSFATLLNPAKQFLASAYQLYYVASGRDLLRTTAHPTLGRNLAIFANPDFGASFDSIAATEPAAARMRSAQLRAFRDMTFRPLPGAEKEARLLEAMSVTLGFQGAALFLGKAATESELARVEGPCVLHLATHGFFLPDPDPAPTRGTNRVGLSPPPQFPLSPMRRSGIALAGAQRTLAAWAKGLSVPAQNDGLVTAEEIGGLNLAGTWLVVLSACDTGLGEARAGEGVLGLRRGFLQAGAQNLLLTLWPIDDEQTARLLLDFYGRAFRTGDAPLALAETQRRWLEKLRKEKGLLEACRLAGPFILSFQGKAR